MQTSMARLAVHTTTHTYLGGYTHTHTSTDTCPLHTERAIMTVLMVSSIKGAGIRHEGQQISTSQEKCLLTVMFR